MNVSLIGFGKAGLELYNELVTNELVKSINVYDPNPTSFSSNVFQGSPKTVFSSSSFQFEDSIDLLVIASPDHRHKQYLAEAIHRDIPSFVEKPFVTSYADLEEIKNLLGSNPGYQSTSNLILRSAPLYQKVKELFASGRFGPKVFIEGKYLYGRWEKIVNGWRGHKDYSVVLGGLIHIIDLACYLTDDYKYKVELHRHRITSREPNDVLDFSQVSLASSETGFFSLTTSFSTNVEHRRDLAIYGDNAWIEIKGDEVRFDVSKLPELENLSPNPVSKGALLSEFISHLNGQSKDDGCFPTMREVLYVMDLCLGKSTY